jgi:hypothetical protein
MYGSRRLAGKTAVGERALSQVIQGIAVSHSRGEVFM